VTKIRRFDVIYTSYIEEMKTLEFVGTKEHSSEHFMTDTDKKLEISHRTSHLQVVYAPLGFYVRHMLAKEE
jgi:hypothetical protein